MGDHEKIKRICCKVAPRRRKVAPRSWKVRAPQWKNRVPLLQAHASPPKLLTLLRKGLYIKRKLVIKWSIKNEKWSSQIKMTKAREERGEGVFLALAACSLCASNLRLLAILLYFSLINELKHICLLQVVRCN